MIKKRHHFVPKAYLQAFCNNDGKLYVYRKDDPEKEICVRTNDAALRNYYYSQPLPDGGYDNNTLEDLFSEYEVKWPELVKAFRANEDVNNNLDTIYAFIALQRARVPAARDACEQALAAIVKATMFQMNSAGKLSPPPKGFEGLLDHVDVAIDPHQSLLAMMEIIRAAGESLDKIGIVVVHNDTEVPFLTSDNPVIWFDPSLPETTMRPYAIQPDGPIMLMFPVASDLLIFGDTSQREQFTQYGLTYGRYNSVEAVNKINRLTCRFAYESVFASRPGLSELVKQYADVSPVLHTDTIPSPGGGQFLHHSLVWGQRTRKPKWKQRDHSSPPE